MVFKHRFTLVLIAWVTALGLALVAAIAAFQTPGLGATRLVAAIVVVGAAWGLWRHVLRTNVMIVRFLEALRHQDFAARFDKRGGAGFDQLGEALDTAVRDLQQRNEATVRDVRMLEALVDDVPVAVLTIDAVTGVRLTNKAARQMFTRHEGTQPEDFACYGATFARRLATPSPSGQELVLLRLAQGQQRAIIRAARLDRLGLAVHAVTVEPVQSTLDEVEMAAQSDLIRVLSHEILNSLTPVTSLTETAAALLHRDPPDLAAAQVAMTTLARRAEGLRRFIEQYRQVANPLEPRVQVFAAPPFAAELARLFEAEWPNHQLTLAIDPDLQLEADPDLLAQALINLLRNGAQATRDQAEAPALRLIMRRDLGQGVIEVEDNGPGIPEHLRPDIFLPFFTTRRDGSGIGLHLVRQIAIALGWSIEVVDVDGGGTRFRLRTV